VAAITNPAVTTPSLTPACMLSRTDHGIDLVRWDSQRTESRQMPFALTMLAAWRRASGPSTGRSVSRCRRRSSSTSAGESPCGRACGDCWFAVRHARGVRAVRAGVALLESDTSRQLARWHHGRGGQAGRVLLVHRACRAAYALRSGGFTGGAATGTIGTSDRVESGPAAFCCCFATPSP
jgi:hypothetical protein